MCDPLTAGALAVSAAGSAISGNEANANAKRMQEARNAATLAEVGRQNAFTAQNEGTFDKSLQMFGPTAVADNLHKAQADVGSTIAGNAPTRESMGSILTSNAPKAAVAGENAKLGDVVQWYADANKRLGDLKGYDQDLQNRGLALNQSGRDIATVDNEAKSSADVAKLEQNAAATNAYKPPSGIGELLSFAGNAGASLNGAGKIGLPSFNGVSTLNTGQSIPNTWGATSVNGAPLNAGIF